MATRDKEIINVIRTSALTVGGRTVFRNEFPMAEGWFTTKLRFGFVITIGTGAGAVAESELLIIKNILMRTDKGEILVNAPGRMMYKLAAIKAGAVPRKDAMAAASATYYVDIPIYHADPMSMDPTDTILDTSRYSSVTVDITLGGLSDLFTAPGTATMTATLDVEIERTKGLLPEDAQPMFFTCYEFVPPVDAATSTTINIDRSTDLALKRIMAHACSSGSSGVPFSGANADDVQNVESIIDQSNYIVQELVHEMIQNRNKDDYGLESVLAGITVFDFVTDGSNFSAILTGDKAKLDYKWTNKAGVAANDLVTIGYEGIRALK